MHLILQEDHACAFLGLNTSCEGSNSTSTRKALESKRQRREIRAGIKVPTRASHTKRKGLNGLRMRYFLYTNPIAAPLHQGFLTQACVSIVVALFHIPCKLLPTTSQQRPKGFIGPEIG
jgi:hypothetical protein